ncbi:glucose 1-dehydrogenase [Rhodobacter sp. KR11]|uniref:glucose 1-dehydrogenase n=1 Tax=Rhodobacter sp. KR11 TaxID=2974588 RepID=UPI0022226D8E|nr:glucose 1-dehydrogenase [Rhodobacter sp. KR11]MCW1918083.1 glucose 1-dehydrogenase [Rhodobacter sp. KR11]
MTQAPRFDFSGKVAFVTGAGSGIGRATALAFAEAGAAVTIADIALPGLHETESQIAALGAPVLALRCDVTQSADIKAALDATIARFGRLDAAFNNAGIEQPGASIVDLTEEMLDRVLSVNLKSVFLCMKHQIPLMLQSGGGAIVNTSSGAGVIAIRNQSGYCASKFGVTVASKVAALEYADQGIRVNALCPGIIDTPMIARYTGGTEAGRAAIIKQEPVGRMGRPEEIAATVLFLCSDMGGFITGHALVADGAQTAGI